MFPSKTAILSGGSGFINQYSLNFDGSDSYVGCGNGSDVKFADADFTISAWIYRANSASHHVIVGYGDDTGSEANWYFRAKNADPDKLQFYARGDGGYADVTGSVTLTDSVWHNVVVTCDKSESDGTQLYVNGSADGSGANFSGVGDMDHASDGLLIGARPNGGAPSGNVFNGKIDEVAIWNTVLTAAQVLEIYNAKGRIDLKTISGSNLKGWWRMGDGTEGASGTTIYDMSTNSNDGTMTNFDGSDFKTDVPS